MNLTLSVPKEIEKEIKERPYIKWTEIARNAIKKEAEELKKKEIFEKFAKKMKISDEEYEFMEKIDWHPVDELEIKKEYLNKILKERKKGNKNIKEFT